MAAFSMKAASFIWYMEDCFGRTAADQVDASSVGRPKQFFAYLLKMAAFALKAATKYLANEKEEPPLRS